MEIERNIQSRKPVRSMDAFQWPEVKQLLKRLGIDDRLLRVLTIHFDIDACLLVKTEEIASIESEATDGNA